MKPNRQRILEQAQSGTARAALLGISDGLVTNVSLILGVVAAGAPITVIRLAGAASMIAGAVSMAVGEYISMQGQRELLSSVLEAERDDIHRNPEQAHAVLQQALEDDGVSESTAHTAAIEIARDPEKASTVYARANLGINPDELGAPFKAAGSSFVMFFIGALIPLAPWLAGSGSVTAFISLSLSVIAALGIGAFLGYTTGGAMWRSALRQLLVLILGAGATFLIGRLFHSTLT
jgi:VIT1/CCC1 family predicted Fe2+/Mn2+ transporter